MRDAYRIVAPFLKTLEKMAKKIDWKKVGSQASDVFTSIAGPVSQLGVGLVNNAISQGNAQEHREWLEKMWEKQNEYNSPANMAARMRAAGLNPFTMMGAEPAGSVGQGSPASTIPINNPLDALRTIAEVRNLNASVGLTESNAEKVLAEVAVIEQQFRLGLITEKEFKELLKYKFEDWAKANPITVDRQAKEAQTAKDQAESAEAVQRTKESEARESYTNSITETENLLRGLRAENLRLSNAEISQRTDNLRQDYRRISEDIQSMSRENAISSSYRVIGNFFGLETLDGLPAELIAKASEYYRDFINGEFTYTSTIEAFQDIVNKYAEKQIHISTSISEAEDVALNVFGASSKKGYKISYSH